MNTRISHLSLPGYVAMTVLLCLVNAIYGSPSDEITRAVSVAGAANIEQASADQFMKAFSSVLLRVRDNDMPAYVSAGVQLRPDYAPQLAVGALSIRSKGNQNEVVQTQTSAERIGPIMQAAFAAAPKARTSIIQAVTAADVGVSRSALAAAGIVDEDATEPSRTGGAATTTHNPSGSASLTSHNTPSHNTHTTPVGTLNPHNTIPAINGEEPPIVNVPQPLQPRVSKSSGPEQ